MNNETDYRIVASALRFLEENFRDQPSLKEVAGRAGMSKYHFQRLFTRWAGVSPKRFLQFLMVEHAKASLRASEPVLHAAFDAGLSGPARLHDLFVTVEGVTPGEYEKRGASVEIAWGVHPTPFGPALLGKTERGLCHLAFLEGMGAGSARAGAASFASSDSAAAEVALEELAGAWPGATLTHSPEDTAWPAKVIFRTGSGARPTESLSLSLFLKGTNFQIKIWNALLRVPAGSLTTYGRLAEALGQPTAARAIGGAVGKNPIAYLIPCHRVIREMGTLGGYRWGPVRKQAILGWEGARKAS